jgi:hypothetical protein
MGQMGEPLHLHPAVLLLGIVIGWVLGSRAARDAFAVELKRREAASARRSSKP